MLLAFFVHWRHRWKNMLLTQKKDCREGLRECNSNSGTTVCLFEKSPGDSSHQDATMCPWAVPSVWLQLLCWRGWSGAWQGQLQARHFSVWAPAVTAVTWGQTHVVCPLWPPQPRSVRTSLTSELAGDEVWVLLLELWGQSWLWGAHRCQTAPKPARQMQCTFYFFKNNQDGISKRSWCWMPLTWQTNTPASCSRNKSFL